MRHAEDERPGPIGQTAGGLAKRRAGFEQAGVDRRRDRVAKHVAERAPHYVGAFAVGEMHLVHGAKMKAIPVEFEADWHRLAAGGIALLMYNGKAFDSCFPLRTEVKRGPREFIRSPLFC